MRIFGFIFTCLLLWQLEGLVRADTPSETEHVLPGAEYPLKDVMTNPKLNAIAVGRLVALGNPTARVGAEIYSDAKFEVERMLKGTYEHSMKFRVIIVDAKHESVKIGGEYIVLLFAFDGDDENTAAKFLPGNAQTIQTVATLLSMTSKDRKATPPQMDPQLREILGLKKKE